MQANVEQRAQTIEKFRTHQSDTGSSEVQIALLTGRINELTSHVKTHKKDFASRRGLLTLVSRRRSLLDYIKRKKPEVYSKIIQELKIRR